MKCQSTPYGFDSIITSLSYTWVIVSLTHTSGVPTQRTISPKKGRWLDETLASIIPSSRNQAAPTSAILCTLFPMLYPFRDLILRLQLSGLRHVPRSSRFGQRVLNQQLQECYLSNPATNPTRKTPAPGQNRDTTTSRSAASVTTVATSVRLP